MIGEFACRPGALAYLTRLGDILLVRALQNYTSPKVQADDGIEAALGASPTNRTRTGALRTDSQQLLNLLCEGSDERCKLARARLQQLAIVTHHGREACTCDLLADLPSG